MERPRRARLAILAGGFALALWPALPSCTPREPTGGDTTTVGAPTADTLAGRVDPRDPTLAALRPRLAEWSRRWAQVRPGFNLDSLYREPPEPFQFSYARPIEPADLRRARVFGERSRDTTRIVEPDIYRALPGGELEGEPDSAPAVLDLRTDSLHVLTVTGTLGGYEEAFWLDDRRVAVVGYGERNFEPWTGAGDVTVYDLSAMTSTVYRTPDVDKETFGRYLQLALQALRARYGAPGA